MCEWEGIAASCLHTFTATISAYPNVPPRSVVTERFSPYKYCKFTAKFLHCDLQNVYKSLFIQKAATASLKDWRGPQKVR